MTPIHAVPAESSAGHRADRRCPCGPMAMRDLNTGDLNVWRHRTPTTPAKPALRGDALVDYMERR